MLSLSQLLFKGVDIFFEKPQNAVTFDNITCVKDIAYANESEAEKGDVYYDKNFIRPDKKMPIVVYIHGGGFVMGDKKYRRTISEFFAHNGFFVYDINYRMPPEVIFPEYVNDFIDAVNYLPTLKEEFDFIDLDRVVITGDSSGGHATSYVAAIAYDDELRKNIGAHELKVKLSAIIPCCGMYDLRRLFKIHFPALILSDMAYMILGEKVSPTLLDLDKCHYFKYLSPIDFVNKDWCPTFIVWGRDDLICLGQGKPMYRKLLDNFIETDSFVAKGIWNNHCYHLMFRKPIAVKAMNESVDFVRSVFADMDKEAG